MTRVAVATTSAIAADAAREIAEGGGNAVDCALASAIMSTNTEPGVCALAGGAYVTVWAPGDEPVTIDGNHGVPGIGLPETRRGRGITEVELEYGGGVTTHIGCGSVAVPGTLAAFDTAWRRFGSSDWRALFQPAIRAAAEGFPLSGSCHYYLGYSGSRIFSRSDEGFRALHDESGRVRDRGSAVVVPGLADSLAAIADGGAAVFYTGDIARAICEHVRDGDGSLTREDLARYVALERPALISAIDDWRIATNPPPAIGGAVLTAMLLACSGMPRDGWNTRTLDTLIRVQRASLDFRRERLDISDDIDGDAADLVEAARAGQLVSRWSSSSTVHTSAVDESGMGCSITASAGYGSGEIPAGTGLWLNNALGEIELHRRDVWSRAPGTRLPSNMAPTVARGPGAVLAIGSPGADRITTAIHQVLINRLRFGMPLGAAVEHPRLHVDTCGVHDQLRTEPGLDLPPTDLPQSEFDGLNMYFGGVGAASWDRHDGFDAAADSRRESGVFVSGA